MRVLEHAADRFHFNEVPYLGPVRKHILARNRYPVHEWLGIS